MTHRTLQGVYLVIDPSMEKLTLLDKVRQALEGGVNIVQVWNNWPENSSAEEKDTLIKDVLTVVEEFDVPVLINEEWQLLKTTGLDGIHFDVIPDNYQQIKEEINREFITGITCGNDLQVVRWADENGFDYISFCAMFPSPSVGSCEIVSPETVREARKITALPLFLSGGITPERIEDLDDLVFNGVAVISGILKEDDPQQRTSDYKQVLSEKESE